MTSDVPVTPADSPTPQVIERLKVGEFWESMHDANRKGPIGWTSSVGPVPRWWLRFARGHRAGWLAGMRFAAEQMERER